MDAGMIKPRLTSPRAKSEGPTSPHRSPMEDTDASGTRKRPRLDSGERTYRSMSADRLRESPSNPDTEPSSVTQTKPSTSNEITTLAPPMTPTKVTINVRETVTTAHPHQTTSSASDQATIPTTAQTPSSPMQSESPRIVSVHSTPSSSPEIQVAEVEDISDEPAVTRWRPLRSNVFEARRLQTELLDAFPTLSPSKSVRRTLSQVALAFEKNDLADGIWLQRFADWIENYLEATQDLNSHWWDLLTEERVFWDELPTIMDGLCRRNDPSKGTIQSLQTNADNDDAENDLDPLTSFLSAWVALALRMTEIDRQTLKDTIFDANTTPDLISDRYLISFQYIMKYDVQFWRSLVDPARYDIKKLVFVLMTRFVPTPGAGLKCLTDTATGILDRPASLSSLIPKFTSHFLIPSFIASAYRTIPNDAQTALLSFIPMQLYQYFVAVDARLQELIGKQTPGLSISFCQNLIFALSTILPAIATSDEDRAISLCNERGLAHQGLSLEERADMLQLSWKFETLRKCIMEGRMEIRVQGVDSMQQDLVNNYKKYVEGRFDLSEHPISLYLSDFLIKNRIVQYLVSADSHPQLMQRSFNIVGFLIVTKKLTNTDTDMIWSALVTSSESRSGEGIVNMLSQCFHLCDYSTLRYLVGKLNELPVTGFDGKMLSFTSLVLTHLRDKWTVDNFDESKKLDMPPFDLCIRLIRQAPPDGPSSPENGRQIVEWAIHHLRHLLPLGPTHQAKEAIFAECLDDIIDPKLSATGSICAIYNLIGDHKLHYIQHLSRDLDMTTILVNDFSRMVHGHTGSHLSPTSIHERLTIRLHLLHLVLLMAPETLNSETDTLLWEALVGSKAISDNARDAAWDTLINVARNSVTRNPYIDLCISRFLPNLSARFLVPGCLTFAEVAKQYIMQSAKSRPPGEQLQGPTAAELMWHLSLTVPSGRGDMEHRAIGMLISLYLDSPDAHRRSREANDSLHIELVERCINQLTAAASKLKAYSDGTSSGEDEPMIIVATDEEAQVQKLSFLRSLMILKEFVRGVRSRPMYSPSPEIPPRLPKDFDRLRGEPIAIKYQAFSEGKKNGDISLFHVGGLETVDDLARKLTLLTGFSKFTAIAGGQRVDLVGKADRKVEDEDFHRKGLLLIRKVASADPMPNNLLASGLRPMEIEVLRHFDDLYGLLNMEEDLARQVYDFLIAFPPHSSITDRIRSPSTPMEDIFPRSAPFKVLYSVHVLKHSLSHQLQTHVVSQEFIIDGINKLVGTLTSPQLSFDIQGLEVDLIVTEGLVDCLVGFLRAVRDPQSSTKPTIKSSPGEDLVIVEQEIKSLLEAEALVDRSLSLISQASGLARSMEADKLMHGTFSIIVEASLISNECWNALKRTQTIPWLLKGLLLEDDRPGSRQVIAKTIKNVCLPVTESPSPLPGDFVITILSALIDIIPGSPALGGNSEQFFDVAHALLGSLSPSDQQRLDVAMHTMEWAELLLKQHHFEFIGRNEIDYFVLGLARLLVYCIQLAKSLGKPINTPPNFPEALFRAQLFPDLCDSTRLPNLFSPTREHLYSIILALSSSQASYRKLLCLIKELTPSGEDISQAWSWGIAQTTEDCNYEPNWNFERFKLVRAPVGYPGLRNLSNTCYMNSLFTQLFMNNKFRHFMLNVNIADGGVSQRLLYETQTLFAFMQESALKSIDTQNIAESIVTYDNTAIDVTHQMDVDEFFNLLFDRWESQILTKDDKKTFRAFFGGQIVQQIKSKECSHISERLEPFSAIQCDITGKLTLAESLNAYVQGEAMEGDNKYSCTSCGKYVDAVKRACLKDVPDNLIFHLKRFDYDLMHGTRTKINDRFEFPMEVDMAPYKVDYLKDPTESPKPDIFALVGVLVHTGTAESGHYYSYIQERPCSSPQYKKWVEFNDVDVSEFNPADIDGQCFGGWQEMPGYETRYSKLWNAYMLFYERTDPLTSQTKIECASLSNCPVKSPLPSDLKDRITTYNQSFLRQYCLYDPAYALFARNMLKQLRGIYGGRCSDDHVVEKDAIWLSLEYMDKILARTKDNYNFDEMLTALTRALGACAKCCGLALQWVSDHEFPLQNLLLRCPHPKVRRDFANMIILTLQKLRSKAPLDYGYIADDDERIHPSELDMPLTSFTGTFHGIAAHLCRLWESIHINSRAWDDYFGLLADLANLGAQESHVLLKLGFLQRCLELLICENANVRSIRTRQPYATYLRMIEKGRKFPYGKLIEFVANLFDRIDFREEPVSGNCDERPFDIHAMPLTEVEYYNTHFRLTGTKGTCVFLEKILNCAINPLATKRIIRRMVLAEPRAKFSPLIENTIRSGLSVDPASLASPFLRAALTFCECTPIASSAERLIHVISLEVHSIGQSGGREHLDFFIQARRLRSLRGAVSPDSFSRFVLANISLWAPQLLMYWEEEVRLNTIDLLRILLFQHDTNNMDDEEKADELIENGRSLCISCAKRCQLVLEEGKPLGRTAEAIVDVINTCLRTFFTGEKDRILVNNAMDIIARVNALAVSDLDDQASVEWANGSEDIPTDSDSDGFGNTP